MKKMIVIREGVIPNTRELDDYLYNSEVTRDDYIDMTPIASCHADMDGLSIHCTTWDVIFKGSDKYDQWHVIVDKSDTYAFDTPAYRAAKILEYFRSDQCTPININHKKNYTVLVYRLHKEVSTAIDSALADFIKTFDGECYSDAVLKETVANISSRLSENETD